MLWPTGRDAHWCPLSFRLASRRLPGGGRKERGGIWYVWECGAYVSVYACWGRGNAAFQLARLLILQPCDVAGWKPEHCTENEGIVYFSSDSREQILDVCIWTVQRHVLCTCNDATCFESLIDHCVCRPSEASFKVNSSLSPHPTHGGCSVYINLRNTDKHTIQTDVKSKDGERPAMFNLWFLWNCKALERTGRHTQLKKCSTLPVQYFSSILEFCQKKVSIAICWL